jgi:hypothetical protein
MSATISRQRTRVLSTNIPVRVGPIVQPVAIAEVAPAEPVVASTVSTAPATNAFQAKLAAFWVANTAANAMVREAKKAKDALDVWMVSNNITSDSAFVDMPNGARVNVAASINETEEEYMDVAKLVKLVDRATFEAIITASKKAVTDAAGTNIVIQATSKRMKPASLSVKELK